MTEMKNAFEGFLSRLDMAKERISELEDRAFDTSKTEKQRKQRVKKQKRIFKNYGTSMEQGL